MNYELCKKLKEAGFPQGSKQKATEDGSVYYSPSLAMYGDDGVLYSIPTLSELIGACGGNGLFKLIKQNVSEDKVWYAGDETNKYYGFGKTPEESVAKLWLALNPLTPTK